MIPLDEAYGQQIGHWRAELASGAERVGWKLGFNSPALQERLGLERPVVGHLTSATLVGADGLHSLAGAARPHVEPELAIEIGVSGAVVGLAPALEVVDLDEQPTAERAGEIVAANVFHRAVVIRPSRERVDPAGLTATVTATRAEPSSVDAGAVDVAGTVALAQSTLEACGESLQTGDRIIAGSLVPPLAVEAGDTVALDLGELGRAAATFTD